MCWSLVATNLIITCQLYDRRACYAERKLYLTNVSSYLRIDTHFIKLQLVVTVRGYIASESKIAQSAAVMRACKVRRESSYLYSVDAL
jgi:hypothetical protein